MTISLTCISLVYMFYYPILWAKQVTVGFSYLWLTHNCDKETLNKSWKKKSWPTIFIVIFITAEQNKTMLVS